MGRNFGKQVSSLAFFQVVAVSEVMVIFPLEIRVWFSPKAHHDVGSPLSLFLLPVNKAARQAAYPIYWNKVSAHPRMYIHVSRQACALMSRHLAGRSSELALLDQLPMQFTFGNLVIHKKTCYLVK